LIEEKYKELYNLSIKVYEEQHNRYVGHQDKATKYLSVLTIIIGLYGYYSKWLIDKIILQHSNIDCIDWIVAFMSFVLFICLIVAWFLILEVMKVRKLAVLPLTDETIKFYYDNKLIDIYYTMSKGIKNAIEINNPILDKMSNHLAMAYFWVKVGSIIFLLLFGLYVLHSLRILNF